MVYSTKEGLLDLTFKKARLNGRVLDKYALADFMRHLDFNKFYWKLLYYDVYSYSELMDMLEDYVSSDDFVFSFLKN